MKRTLPVLLAITFLFVLACTRHAAVSTPGTNHNPPSSQSSVVNQKNVNIIISTVNGTCVILDPGDILLTKNQDKIKWCVDYRCSDTGVRVMVDDFRDSKDVQKVMKRNPFGNHSDGDNTFDFAGSDCNKVTGLATISGHYYYRILVLRTDGSVLASLDPGVIIGD
jgi:hypothetical protein